MRQQFASYLHEKMKQDDRIFLLTADLGYNLFEPIKEEFPSRYVDVGAAEQLLIGAAVGLAQEGKIPVCYSITPFLLFRGAEWIRNYLNHEGANVKLIGSGRDDDYEHDGFTHWAGDDLDFIYCFSKISAFWPESVEEMQSQVDAILSVTGSCYLNLRK